MFNLSNVDAVYLHGDFDMLIGSLDDCISDVDNIPELISTAPLITMGKY